MNIGFKVALTALVVFLVTWVVDVSYDNSLRCSPAWVAFIGWASIATFIVSLVAGIWMT